LVKAESSNPDRELVARLTQGDERALAELYDRFGGMAFALAYRILGDSADAEETVADAFIQAWTSAHTFDPARASVPAWLCMITRTRSLDRLRARKRRARIIEQAALEGDAMEATALPLGSTGAAPDRRAEQSDLRDRVAQSLASLPDNQRQVIELAYFGGLSHSEIAEQLNEPLGTVKTRVRAAMSKLRDALTAYQFVNG
jgi:RNA polymerase sigma-70 factor (ECF subfamily)